MQFLRPSEFDLSKIELQENYFDFWTNLSSFEISEIDDKKHVRAF